MPLSEQALLGFSHREDKKHHGKITDQLHLVFGIWKRLLTNHPPHRGFSAGVGCGHPRRGSVFTTGSAERKSSIVLALLGGQAKAEVWRPKQNTVKTARDGQRRRGPKDPLPKTLYREVEVCVPFFFLVFARAARKSGRNPSKHTGRNPGNVRGVNPEA